MIELLLRLLIAALLALTGLSAEEDVLAVREVVTETCSPDDIITPDGTCESTPPPSELPGPRETGGLTRYVLGV
jgi:hypothetical protein